MSPGRRLAPAAALVLMLAIAGFGASPSAVRGQSAQDVPDAPDDPPDWILGTFVDDYGARYSITPERWLHGTHAGYGIVEWNAERRYLVAHNDASNPTDPERWSRIDWVELDGTDGWAWGYCYAVYDAETAAAAEQAPDSRRASPRDGCNGFPFSRMRRDEGPGARGS